MFSNQEFIFVAALPIGNERTKLRLRSIEVTRLRYAVNRVRCFTTTVKRQYVTRRKRVALVERFLVKHVYLHPIYLGEKPIQSGRTAFRRGQRETIAVHRIIVRRFAVGKGYRSNTEAVKADDGIIGRKRTVRVYCDTKQGIKRRYFLVADIEHRLIGRFAVLVGDGNDHRFDAHFLTSQRARGIGDFETAFLFTLYKSTLRLFPIVRIGYGVINKGDRYVFIQLFAVS